MSQHYDLAAAFEKAFGLAPAITIQAPGRVNLIGEHTDYNDGFVFPVAINFGTWIAATPREDRIIDVLALDYGGERVQFSLDQIEHVDTATWSNYVRGVCKVLLGILPDLKGANLAVTGNVPQGAGLSSSASFEVALVKMFKSLYNLDVTGVDAALLGQKAENTFVGCSCGIMDQLISAMGKQGEAMLLDCRSLEFQYTPLPDSHAIVIINSNVKRGLVDSEYNVRRKQCEEGANIMGVTALRDAELSLLEQHKPAMSKTVYRRARHIITENQRTLDMYYALRAGRIDKVSELMAQSHISMREDFEITVPPIDYIVEIIDDVLGKEGGVRMTGGGFGGCVVALVPKNRVSQVMETVDKLYHTHTGFKQSMYICSAAQGAFA
ncbi:MAG: galactokinase [Gammaproteobacteria bacterium]|nr:galactokinase [Gammaproteobacteria bacterium]